jgi:CRISPR-associated endonuclease/helicase Cas3
MKKSMQLSIDSVEAIMKATPSLSSFLKNADLYFAHLDRNGIRAPELLEEHYDRVNSYFALICQKNGLDTVIDNLITDYVCSFFPKSDFLETCQHIKRLFVNTAVYHDFGKVNDNFQAHPEKMNNPNFRMIKNHPLKHHHSQLGAYLYIVKHFQEVFSGLSFLAKENQRQLFMTILLFSYPIFRHHASRLRIPDGKGIRFETEELTALKKYLDCYGFQIHPELAEKGMEPAHLQKSFFQWIYEVNKVEFGFSFFALIRLNFGLLTAADYMATGEYSYDLQLIEDSDWGILSDEQRARIIYAAEFEKSYNTEAYRLFRQHNYVFQNPQDQSEKNLNVLRTEMAVKVLRQLEAHKNKRLFYLEAPTGGGKTNFSMLAAAELLRANPELNKVFYVFPFTTLITQTHKSIKETLKLEDSEIALLHGKIGFQTITENNEGESEEEKKDGIYGKKRRDFIQNLFALYPILLATHVRFFDILKSSGKEESYLMHRIANSIVILDELQSYNPKHWDKMMYLLEQYSKFFNIRFILMSATLPRLDKIKAVKAAAPDMPKAEDLLPDAREYFVNSNFKGRVKFNFQLLNEKQEMTEAGLAAVVLEKSKQRASLEKSEDRVFTIVEFIFKKTATAFKDEIEKQQPFFDHVFVLSGTILESRRREIIYFLKRNKKSKRLKVLLITTQVVEAGVDIDMDLGFKNVSLIDSDEQLAGRVNRNVGKEGCEVYLFKLNEPNVLYGKDLRYQITKDLPPEFHQNILENKDFMALYERVFIEIDKRNESQLLENFKDNYLGYFKKMNFPDIHSKFQLIEQNTLSVFVPLSLPVTVESEEGKPEAFFSDYELNFLKDFKIFSQGDCIVSGEKIWELYRRIVDNPEVDFISKKIERKAIQGVLSKFTFSIFDSDKIRKSLAEYTNPELSYEKYLYLSDYLKIYQYESGLMESKFNDPENSIL